MTAEKPAPSRKKTDRPIRIPVSPGSRKSSPNTTAAKSTRVRNIRLRYAAAPSWTAWAIICIRGVPSCAAYLNRMFRTLVLFAAVVFGLLFLLPGDTGIRVGRSVFFLLGAGFSAVIGYLGMWLAVRANVRVAAAAGERGGRAAGARIAFRTGGVVGMSVVGLGLVGASTVVLIYRGDAPAVLEGFGFGAALLAMFMRVGGGIFTKAADVGADLVGKVEHGIPEDDARNPATIADNVGDNVGDCAGMAADLFESYAVTLVAALILGRENGLRAIYRGFYLSALVGALLSAVAAFVYLPSSFAELRGVSPDLATHVADPRVVTTPMNTASVA